MLASSPTFAQTIIVSVLTSGTVAAVVTGLFKLTEQSRQHAHERKRQIRDERKAIYPDAADLVTRSMEGLTHLERQGPRPDTLVVDEAKRRELVMAMSLFASYDVYALFGQFSRAAREYGFSLAQYWQAREQQAGAETLGLLWQNLEASREQTRGIERNLQKLIRHELETL